MIENISYSFISVLKDRISTNSRIYIQCNQITFSAISELIDELKAFNRIQVLVGNAEKTINDFGNINHDYQLRSDLQSILKANKLLNFPKNKIEFKKGFFGVNSIIVENAQDVKAFIYTHETLNSQVLGLTPSKFPMITTELSTEQAKTYLNLFHKAYMQAEYIQQIEDLVTLNVEQAIPKSQYLYSLGHLFDDYERIENYENLERTGFFNIRKNKNLNEKIKLKIQLKEKKTTLENLKAKI